MDIVPDSHYESVATDNLAYLVSIDKLIDGAEHDGVEARWKFGRELLKERVGKQLPAGRMETICVATRKSKAEISNRMQFAAENPTEEEVSNILDTFGSWLGICQEGLGERKAHVSHNSGENEWYTPAEYLHAAREVMGGIDLDPASTREANTIVQAEQFCTIADDGLTQDWYGRVWLNPPYAQPLIGKFAEKLVDEYVRDNIEQACVLVNNATETEWFLHMASVANAFCFPKTRIKFWAPDRSTASPLQGQAFMYLGEHYLEFTRIFQRFDGVCLVKP